MDLFAEWLTEVLRRPFAKRLARIMLSMTKPGGKVLIPNFVPDIPDVGYMEAFMDWKLVFRDGNELLDLFDHTNIADFELFYGANENIVYLLVHKSKYN